MIVIVVILYITAQIIWWICFGAPPPSPASHLFGLSDKCQSLQFPFLDSLDPDAMFRTGKGMERCQLLCQQFFF